MLVKISSRKRFKKYLRFRVQVLSSYRMPRQFRNRTLAYKSGYSSSPPPLPTSSTSDRQKRVFYIYELKKHAKCNCPRLFVKKRYLLLTGLGRIRDASMTRGQMLLNRKSTVVRYTKLRNRRIEKFSARRNNGQCAAARSKKKKKKRRH